METIAGLDIGSTQITAVIKQLADKTDPVSEPITAGMSFGSTNTMGFRKGVVSDVPTLACSIKEALAQAESVAGVKAEIAHIAFPGHTVEFNVVNYRGLIGKSKKVSVQDIERINRLVRVAELPPGRQIIQAIPLEYILDGAPVVGEPLGMYCTRLEIKSMIITADNTLISCLMEAVQRCGVRIGQFLPSSLAMGEAILNNAEIKLGTALVDIGGTCTGILYYNHGYPLGFEVLPVGSDHITSDLAICLRTTLAGAEEVKRNIGLQSYAEKKEEIEENNIEVTIPRMSGAGVNTVPIETVENIIEARVGEMLELVKSSVNRLAGNTDLPGGLVLAGNGSMLKGLEFIALKYLGTKLRLSIQDINGQHGYAGEENSGMVGVTGLIKFFLKDCGKARVFQPPSGFWKKVSGIFRNSK